MVLPATNHSVLSPSPTKSHTSTQRALSPSNQSHLCTVAVYWDRPWATLQPSHRKSVIRTLYSCEYTARIIRDSGTGVVSSQSLYHATHYYCCCTTSWVSPRDTYTRDTYTAQKHTTEAGSARVGQRHARCDIQIFCWLQYATVGTALIGESGS